MRLHVKLFITLIVFTLLLLVSVYAYLDHTITEQSFQRIQKNLLNATAIARTYLTYSLAHKESMQQIAESISRDLDVRATIVDVSGEVYADVSSDGKARFDLENHADRPEIKEAFKKGVGKSVRFSTTVKRDMLYIAREFRVGQNHGVVRLSMPLDEIDFIHKKMRDLLIGACILAFLIALFLSIGIAHIISKPVKHIAQMAGVLARGELSHFLHVKSHDEIGELAATFNEMARQIQTRIDEVTQGKSRLEAILLSMFDGVMVVDAKSKILLVNSSLKKMLVMQKDPQGKKTIEVVRNLEIQELVDVVLGKQEGVESRELSIVLDIAKTVLVHATPVVREGVTEGAVLVFHDISELKRLEGIRRDFVANVSHELRTPLSSIKGYAETLLDGAIDDKKHAKEFLRIIHDDAVRLANLVNDLLDLSKIESGKLTLILQPLKVKDVIEQVSTMLKHQANVKKIDLSISVSDAITKIYADESRLAQVFVNLIDNAIKYTPQGGSVMVSAKESDSMIAVSVSDTGVGISEEDQERLFERFYRVDKARSRSMGGTGLGLAIVKHIVQAHKGTIKLTSELGKGSTFTISFPKV